MVEADLPVCGRVRACSRQILIRISVNRRCKRGEGEARQASKSRAAKGSFAARMLAVRSNSSSGSEVLGSFCPLSYLLA